MLQFIRCVKLKLEGNTEMQLLIRTGLNVTKWIVVETMQTF